MALPSRRASERVAAAAGATPGGAEVLAAILADTTAAHQPLYRDLDDQISAISLPLRRVLERSAQLEVEVRELREELAISRWRAEEEVTAARRAGAKAEQVIASFMMRNMCDEKWHAMRNLRQGVCSTR